MKDIIVIGHIGMGHSYAIEHLLMEHATTLDNVIVVTNEEQEQQQPFVKPTPFVITTLPEIHIAPHIERTNKPHQFTKQVKTSYKRMK